MNANKLKMNAEEIKYIVLRSVRKKLIRSIYYGEMSGWYCDRAGRSNEVLRHND